MRIRIDTITLTDILLALLLLFVFLYWLRDNPTYIWLKRKKRLFIQWVRNGITWIYNRIVASRNGTDEAYK